MSRIPVVLRGWEYDEESKRIVATFTNTIPQDPDPEVFRPTQVFEVELLPRAVAEEPVVQPEQEDIAELNVVVDQLVLDLLMGGL